MILEIITYELFIISVEKIKNQYSFVSQLKCGWEKKVFFSNRSSFVFILVALKRAGCFGCLLDDLLGGLVRLLGEEDSLDVGENTSLSNGNSSKKFVQLLIISDGQLQVTGDDPGLLVVSGSITSQLKNLSSKVFHDSS